MERKLVFEGKIPSPIEKEFQETNINPKPVSANFDEQSQKEFLKGAKIAYETIITDFSDSDNKLIASKSLLSKKIFDQFKEALEQRERRGQFAEITFIGIKSALVKSYKKVENSFEGYGGFC